MNTKLTITAISFMAVILGISAIVPVLQEVQAMKINKVIVIVSNADEKNHAKCTLEYDDAGRTISQAKHTNSKGEAIYPVRAMPETISAHCTLGEDEFRLTDVPFEPRDEIMVLLMPSPG